jgi:hypothetical protein
MLKPTLIGSAACAAATKEKTDNVSAIDATHRANSLSVFIVSLPAW